MVVPDIWSCRGLYGLTVHCHMLKMRKYTLLMLHLSQNPYYLMLVITNAVHMVGYRPPSQKIDHALGLKLIELQQCTEISLVEVTFLKNNDRQKVIMYMSCFVDCLDSLSNCFVTIVHIICLIILCNCMCTVCCVRCLLNGWLWNPLSIAFLPTKVTCGAMVSISFVLLMLTENKELCIDNKVHCERVRPFYGALNQ